MKLSSTTDDSATTWYDPNNQQLSQQTVGGVTGWYTPDGTKVADDYNGSPAQDPDGNAILNNVNTSNGLPAEDNGVTHYGPGGPPPDPTRRPPTQNPPPVVAPGVDRSTGKFTSVDPGDLSAIANTLGTLVGPINDAVAGFDGIAVKAGHFTQADNLKTLVGGTGVSGGGMIDTYRTNCAAIVDGFHKMIDALNHLAREFANGDDMAGGDANKVQNDMAGVVNALTGASGAPTSIPGYTPPNPNSQTG